jgi:hypothetical protein
MSCEERLQGNIVERDKEKLRRSLEGPGLVNDRKFHGSRGGIWFRKGIAYGNFYILITFCQSPTNPTSCYFCCWKKKDFPSSNAPLRKAP